MRIAYAKTWSRGVDCITALNSDTAAALKSAGAEFVCRYFGHVTATELAAILGAGLGLAPIAGYGRGGSWNKATGAADANFALEAARSLGVPLRGDVDLLTFWCDLEGSDMAADDARAYVQAWAGMIASSGACPGLYVGAGVPLSAEELYALPVKAYWRSCSAVPEVAQVGYQMIQLTPPNQMLAGVQVDFDVVQADRAGRLPAMIWA
jgi:Domain of unknown function (DUF1906)